MDDPHIDDQQPMWRFAMNGTLRQATTTTAALEQIIDDYSADLDEPAAFSLRLSHAATVANATQARLLFDFDHAAQNLTEEEMNALTADKADQVLVGEWTADIPLVYLVTNYFPYSSQNLIAPSGEVVPIDPSDEFVYMSSLLRVGWVDDLSE